MAGYDPNKAAAYNKLIQQGLSEEQAARQAGISEAEAIDYAVNEVGSNNPRDASYNPNFGKIGPLIVGANAAEYNKAIASGKTEQQAFAELQARRAEAKRERLTNRDEFGDDETFERSPVVINENTPPGGTVTQTNYTTTSTETVSGGGSTTTIRGPRISTAASEALQPAIDAKQAEIDQFKKDNPSNFARERQGLPPLTREENLARLAKQSELNDQATQLRNGQTALESATPPTVITVPNTTTTTQTVTTGTSSTNQAVDPFNDEKLSQENEAQLDATPSAANALTTREAAPVPGAPGLRDPQQQALAAPAPVDDFVIDPDTNEQIPSDSDRAAEIRAEQAAQEQVQVTAPAPVADSTQAEGTAGEAEAGAPQLTPEQQAANEQAAAKANAINQATLNSVYKQGGGSDWRFRLQLAKTSTYFYNAEPPGILEPLAATNGVIFPYTPAINTSYKANYEQYDLVHSNYRGVYYKNSRVDDLNIRGTFTAQDTREADYLLAVIHFFRSVTKMFYGKDEERGTPPPLVFLSGLGPNQFFDHPCVVSNFQYNLPDNVDYIRATSVNNYGTDLLSRRTPNKSSNTPGLGATGNRLLNAGLDLFKNPKPPPPPLVASVNNTQLANYVPTRMEIDLTLIPVQTRSQVSKQFSLKGFANGDLIKGGFW